MNYVIGHGIGIVLVLVAFYIGSHFILDAAERAKREDQDD